MDGCQSVDVKPVCFSPYCKRNVLMEKSQLKFENSLSRMKFALNTLSACKEPAKLICERNTFIVTRQNLKQLDVNELQKSVLEHIEGFCSSFGKNLNEDDLRESKAVKCSGFDGMEEMAKLAIDFKAAQLFFNLIKQVQGVYRCQIYIEELADRLLGQALLDEKNDMKQAMVCRGLLLTMSYIDVSSTTWHSVTLKVLKAFVQVTKNENQKVDLVVAHQPKIVFIDLIMQLQDLL